MSEIQRFSNQIDALNPENFHDLALDIFRFQYSHNKIYKKYVDALGKVSAKIDRLEDIPFLPIEFFKTQELVSTDQMISNAEAIFHSSGTTGFETSKHFVFDLDFYQKHSLKLFEDSYGGLDQYCILALLPSYLERSNSSLVAMVNYFIESSESQYAGFYLYNYQELLETIVKIRKEEPGRKIILWGVSFALLDIAEQFAPDLSDCLIMETGGMKGRREELTRDELHNILTEAFQVKEIHSEYGMTELLSQSYSKGHGVFQPSSTMKILIREANDPFSTITHPGKAGGINVIDLANIDSCSFIETKDIGKLYSDGSFEVLGRFDNSDIRGCNLLVS